MALLATRTQTPILLQGPQRAARQACWAERGKGTNILRRAFFGEPIDRQKRAKFAFPTFPANAQFQVGELTQCGQTCRSPRVLDFCLVCAQH